MKEASYFDELLLKLEGDDGLWKIKDPKSNHPIWPFVRHKVLFHLLYAKRKINSIETGHRSTSWEKIKSVFFSVFAGNPFALAFKKPQVLIFNSGISNVKAGNKYFNRLADYFFDAAPRVSALVEETAFGKHALPRHKRVFSHFLFRVLAKAVIAFDRADRQKTNEKIDELLDVLQAKLQADQCSESFIAEVKVEIQNKLKDVYAESILYRLFFKFVKPKLILVEDACYGARAHLITIAKANSICVAEYQHGFINRFHLAYNYGPAILENNGYAAYFPDVYLAYGEYWGKVIRVPVSIIPIGNPYLSEFSSSATKATTTEYGIVLGAGVGTEAIMQTVLRIKPYFDQMNLETLFRPHPLEWSNADEVYRQLTDHGVKLDTFTNLYDSLTRSAVIVGELSTALFEARNFTDRVYMINNDYLEFFGDDARNLFSSLEDGIINKFSAQFLNHREVFWQHGWKENYQRFLRSVLGESH